MGNDPSQEAILRDASATATLRTVARVVAVLELVSDGSALTVSQIASRLDLPISSAHSVVKRLNELGYLEVRLGERSYQAGPTLVRLGIKITGSIDVMTAARPYISALAESTGEDVYLALVDKAGIVYADRVEGRQSLRLSIALGEPRPLHSTAVGKLYLAQLSDSVLAATLGQLAMIRHTENTITSPETLRRQLRQIRRDGYSVTDQEHLDGVAAVAAPVLGSEGQFIASITIALPRSRFLSKRADLIREVTNVAKDVSAQLGWRQESVAPGLAQA